MQGGESWQDGPCRVCECESRDWRPKCSVQQCPAAPVEADFVVEAFPQPKHCCPQYKRTACRLGNKLYKVSAMTFLILCRKLYHKCEDLCNFKENLENKKVVALLIHY